MARLENVIGWYHSHPGYGCWLSGIDVSTQMLNQQFQEPWVALVVSDIHHSSCSLFGPCTAEIHTKIMASVPYMCSKQQFQCSCFILDVRFNVARLIQSEQSQLAK